MNLPQFTAGRALCRTSRVYRESGDSPAIMEDGIEPAGYPGFGPEAPCLGWESLCGLGRGAWCLLGRAGPCMDRE